MVGSLAKTRPSSNNRTRVAWRFKLNLSAATSPPSMELRMTLYCAAIGLTTRIGSAFAAKSTSHAASTNEKLMTS